MFTCIIAQTKHSSTFTLIGYRSRQSAALFVHRETSRIGSNVRAYTLSTRPCSGWSASRRTSTRSSTASWFRRQRVSGHLWNTSQPRVGVTHISTWQGRTQERRWGGGNIGEKIKNILFFVKKIGQNFSIWGTCPLSPPPPLRPVLPAHVHLGTIKSYSLSRFFQDIQGLIRLLPRQDSGCPSLVTKYRKIKP